MDDRPARPWRIVPARYTWKAGSVLRLFSMFPAGAPGVALLMLRLSLAAAILDTGSDCLKTPFTLTFCLVLAVQSLLLCVGFLTPIVSVVSCLVELSSFFLFVHTDGQYIVLTSVNAAAIALLGPGVYSLDARLFGRRVITFPPEGTADRG
jgi:uncharacterized membrane protein YphA (DoxX/SURF4 family)